MATAIIDFEQSHTKIILRSAIDFGRANDQIG